MERTHRQASLALPFAALGLAGGTLSAHVTVGLDHLHSHGDGFIGALLMVLTPLTCAFLGEYLRGRVKRAFVARTLLATVLAGALNGVGIGLFVGAGAGVLVGASCGFFFSLPFVPATLLIVGAGRSVGRAGVGSLVDTADRRGVWAATFAAIALGALVATFQRGGPPPLFLTSVALAGLLAISLLDVIAAHRLRRLAALTEGMRLRQHVPMEITAGAQAFDLGVGDEAWDEVARSPTPYREADRLVRVVHGNPAQARAAVGGALRRDGIAMALAVGALLLQRVMI
jgi:hypothetical protein